MGCSEMELNTSAMGRPRSSSKIAKACEHERIAGLLSYSATSTMLSAKGP
jgi:hypothetical protein